MEWRNKIMSTIQKVKEIGGNFNRLLQMVVALGTALSFIVGLLLNYFELDISTIIIAIMVIVATTAIFLLTIIIKEKHSEINNLQHTFEIIHSINHYYRDIFAEAISDNCSTIIEPQKTTLQLVSDKINQVFSLTIGGRKCVVTVYSYDTEKKVITPYVRYGPGARGLQVDEREYKNEATNTAFFEALKYRPNNNHTPPCYFSSDLTKEEQYFSERVNYLVHYRAQIVVPIRCRENDTDNSRVIGLLGIDTTYLNVFRQPYHLQLAFAFADQIYTYWTLARKLRIREE